MRRWWDAATALILIGLALVAALRVDNPALNRWGPLVLLAVIAVLYVTGFRRFIPRSFGCDEPEPGLGVALPLQAALIVLMAGAVTLNADMMNGMMLVIPLIWMSAARPVHAIIGTIVATAALGIGFSANQGWSEDGTISGFWIAIISAVFGIALGMWISSIARWGTERSRLLTELTQAQGQLEAAHRESGAAAERERLARDIHDTIAQSLTSMVMLAERAREEENPAYTIALLEDTARNALTDSRTLVAANASVTGQDRSSLRSALTRLGERFARETGLEVVTDVEVEGRLPRELEVMLLRCMQEGLANVRKHARASRVDVALAPTTAMRPGADRTSPETVPAVTLLLRDDGDGLRGASIDDERGFGLTGMRERVAQAGGTFSVADAGSTEPSDTETSSADTSSPDPNSADTSSGEPEAAGTGVVLRITVPLLEEAPASPSPSARRRETS